MYDNKVLRHVTLNELNAVNALTVYELITANGLYVFDILPIFTTNAE
jgi:hypothetical protein